LLRKRPCRPARARHQDPWRQRKSRSSSRRTTHPLADKRVRDGLLAITLQNLGVRKAGCNALLLFVEQFEERGWLLQVANAACSLSTNWVS
jgi:hypothetical protein